MTGSEPAIQWEAKQPAHENMSLVSDEGRKAPNGKVKLQPGFFRGLLAWSTVIHFVALASTLLAVSLNIRNWYWADADPTGRGLLFRDIQQSQDVLQFVAKLHGNIIVASLSAIVLHIVRRMLVGDGVSWGLMAGAYQVGAASWFFSWDFLGPLLTPGKRRNWLFGLGLGFAFVYSAIVAPASAIVILPKLSWWPVKSPYDGGAGSALTTYTVTPYGSMYPESLTEIENPTMEDCKVNMARCPGFGFSSIRNLVGEWGLSGKDPATSIKARGSDANRVLRASPMYSVFDKSYVGVASTLPAPIVETMGLFADFVERETSAAGAASDILQPRFRPAQDTFASLVQVECTPFSYHDYVETGKGEGTPGFRASGLRNLGLVPGSKDDGYQSSSQWDLPESQWNIDQELDETTFKWVDVVTGDSSTQPSLGALFTIPFARNTTRGLAQDSLILPCVIDARWAKVDVHYDPKTSNTIGHDLDDLSILGKFWGRTNGTSLPKDFEAKRVRLSPTWANLLDGELPDPFDNLSETNAIKALLEFFFGLNDMLDNDGVKSFEPPIRRLGRDKDKAVAATVATILSLVVAEGMSRQQFPEQYVARVEDFNNGTSLLAPLWYRAAGFAEGRRVYSQEVIDTWTALDWKVERYGWGYSMQPPTTKAAVAILLTHVLVLLVYLVYVAWFRLSRKGWSSVAWSALPDLVSLALMSSPRDSDSVAMLSTNGRKRRDPTVKIRTYDGESPQMVIGQPDYEGEPIMRGKKYS
jgi:hypothetical protein